VSRWMKQLVVEPGKQPGRGWKICSPRREPWGYEAPNLASRGAAEHSGLAESHGSFAPLGLDGLRSLHPMAHAMGYRTVAATRLEDSSLMTSKAKEKLIVALDVETADKALELFALLRNVVGVFKIGSQLFTSAGPQIVQQIVAEGGRVFLDLKFHDIPNTVAAAAIEATRLGVFIFNVHASGGVEMMKRTAEAVTETATREGISRPGVIAVTMLTSLNADHLREIGIDTDSNSLVSSLAHAAADCGLDGVVASPREIGIVRAAVSRPDFLIVTPGIRSGGDARDDQTRTMSAAEAIRAGADYLVVGRPILKAADPVRAAEQMVLEIENASQL
jgi:orotidine-5'-phosphate decarboxylase